MSEGWARVNGRGANERRRGAAKGGMPSAVEEGLEVEFIVPEAAPAPAGAFARAG
jgi:hypothetical protein